MKFLYLIFIFFVITGASIAKELTGDDIFDIKQNAFALYNTNHINEAYEMLNKIPNDKKDEEIYLILANIEQDKNNEDEAIKNLELAIQKKPEFYKAYYNLGCIFMKKEFTPLQLQTLSLQKNIIRTTLIFFIIWAVPI